MIATPVSSHYALAKMALEAGKHVLVEKPLCRSVAEGEELVVLAHKVGKLLCVGHIFLFNNAVRGGAEPDPLGRVGPDPLHLLHPHQSWPVPHRCECHVGPGHARHQHPRLLAGERADIGHGVRYVLSYPRCARCGIRHLQLPQQRGGLDPCELAEPARCAEITIVGENKMVVLDDINLNEPLRLYHKSVAIEREPVYSDSFGSFRMLIRNGDIVSPSVTGPEPLAAECNHFVDCILGRAVPINDGNSGVRVLRVLEAVDRSMSEQSRWCP